MMDTKTKLTREELAQLKQDMSKVPKAERGEGELPGKFWDKLRLKMKTNQNLKKASGPEKIAVFYINQKEHLEGPFATTIYGGSFLVIRNHVYRFNPNRVMMWGKHKVCIVRWYDRDLVKSLEDFEEIIKQGADKTPLNDPVLIKALLNAKLSEKPAVQMNKAMLWIGGAALLGLVIFMLVKGGGGGAVAPPAPTG